MKFETLKTRVKKAISERMRQPAGFRWDMLYGFMPAAIQESLRSEKTSPKDLLIEFEDEAYHVVDRWDIRCAGKLVALFPEALPEKYRKVPFTVDMDEDGNWTLFFEGR